MMLRVSSPLRFATVKLRVTKSNEFAPAKSIAGEDDELTLRCRNPLEGVNVTPPAPIATVDLPAMRSNEPACTLGIENVVLLDADVPMLSPMPIMIRSVDAAPAIVPVT